MSLSNYTLPSTSHFTLLQTLILHLESFFTMFAPHLVLISTSIFSHIIWTTMNTTTMLFGHRDVAILSRNSTLSFLWGICSYTKDWVSQIHCKTISIKKACKDMRFVSYESFEHLVVVLGFFELLTKRNLGFLGFFILFYQSLLLCTVSWMLEAFSISLNLSSKLSNKNKKSIIT